jgi:inosine-uridine nucleoside N-ribohydrolase
MKTARFLLPFAALFILLAVARSAQGQAAPAAPTPAAEPQLAILDTDIGDDIDDAFALALALRSPELKLLGVTTAFGDTELRARLVDRFLTTVGGNVGISINAGIESKAPNVFTQAAYARQDFRNVCGVQTAFKDDAVDWLLLQIRAHPGRVTLIAIGPLTNVEEAIKRDPATFRKLKRVVLMGGSIYRGYDGPQNGNQAGERRGPDAEWNVSRDPAGLRALLASGVPVFMMPLDSTQIHLGTADREAIFSHGSPLTDQLTLLYHQWLAGTEGHPPAPTLFDPVAVAYAVKPELCPMTPMRLEVDDKGFTKPVEGAPNAQVCLKSDEKGFLDLLLTKVAERPAR